MAESVIPDHLKYPTLGLVSSFVFKLEDSKGHVHRFNCGMSHFEWPLLAMPFDFDSKFNMDA